MCEVEECVSHCNHWAYSYVHQIGQPELARQGRLSMDPAYDRTNGMKLWVLKEVFNNRWIPCNKVYKELKVRGGNRGLFCLIGSAVSEGELLSAD
jgi:hypothetical protein